MRYAQRVEERRVGWLKLRQLARIALAKPTYSDHLALGLYYLHMQF